MNFEKEPIVKIKEHECECITIDKTTGDIYKEIKIYRYAALPCCENCLNRNWETDDMTSIEYTNNDNKKVIMTNVKCKYANICKRIYDMYNKEK